MSLQHFCKDLYLCFSSTLNIRYDIRRIVKKDANVSSYLPFRNKQHLTDLISGFDYKLWNVQYFCDFRDIELVHIKQFA